MKKILLLLITALLISSCGTTELTNETSSEKNIETTSTTDTEVAVTNEKVQVSSSIIPLSSVINAVGGEYVEVENIVPAGVSPHGFDLSAKQMASISESKIIFLTGLEHIDGFLEKAADTEKQIHLADGMELLEAAAHDHSDHGNEHSGEHGDHGDEHRDDHDDEEHHDDDEHKDDHDDNHKDEHDDDDHDDEHGDEHGDVHGKDPHVWLGKDNIMTIADKVRDELSAALPGQAEYFKANTESFKADLEKAYADFSEETAGKTPAEFIVFHDAYNYLLQSIGMDTNLKIPFSENVLHDVGTGHMAELVEEIKLHSIRHAFTEPQFNAGVLEKLATEHGLTVGMLDPIGKDPSATGYIENLRSNLDTISKVYE